MTISPPPPGQDPHRGLPEQDQPPYPGQYPDPGQYPGAGQGPNPRYPNVGQGPDSGYQQPAPYPTPVQYPGPGTAGYQGPPGYGPSGLSPAVEMCAFHPDRQTALHCSRCGRPACPECLTPASVGFQCRACVAEGRAAQRVPRTVTGARVDQKPIVTYALIGINVLVFLIVAIQAKSGVDMSGSAIYRDGFLVPSLVAGGQWWRLVTSGFLHVSVIHVGLNMLSLYVLGVALERMLGHGRFLTVYLLALIGGSAAVMLFTDPFGPTVGASGAIFGLMGGLVVVFKRFKFDMRQLLIVLAVNLYLSFQLAGISWQAHVGGLIVGAVATAAMVYPSPAIRKKVQIGSVVLIVVVVVAVVLLRDAHIAERYCGIAADGYFQACTS